MELNVKHGGALKGDLQRRLTEKLESRLKSIAGEDSPGSITADEAKKLSKSHIDAALSSLLKDAFHDCALMAKEKGEDPATAVVPVDLMTECVGEIVQQFVNGIINKDGLIDTDKLANVIMGGFGGSSGFISGLALETFDTEDFSHLSDPGIRG